VIAKKPNKFLQSMSQFPLQNAMLKLRVRKKGAAYGLRPFAFYPLRPEAPPMPRDPIQYETDLSALRRRITELVARNAVAMVQQAIDAVKEEGQYQAIKYLFEMIGLYPAIADDTNEAQSSLAQTLLDQLGLEGVAAEKATTTKVTARHPVELD
jgi:hypothetical protein